MSIFDKAIAAVTPKRTAAKKKLGVLLTGHSITEESIIYPALAIAEEKGHAPTAYTEQSVARMEMAALETLAPVSQDYLDKLEHIRGVVAHHLYEEEGNWFIDLEKKVAAADQSKLTTRYNH
jgi:hypothetical protein